MVSNIEHKGAQESFEKKHMPKKPILYKASYKRDI